MKTLVFRLFASLIVLVLLAQVSPAHAINSSTKISGVSHLDNGSKNTPSASVLSTSPFFLPAETTGQVQGFSCDSVLDVTQSECEALVAFYYSTNGNSWTNSSNWLTGTAVSAWYGVTVSDGFVDLLILPTNELSGSIPPDLKALSNLQTLDIHENLISGSIPPELGSLTNLQYLDLGLNQLSGKVPPELGSLAELATLYLDSNPLLVGSLPMSFVNLNLLNYFDFYDTNLCEPFAAEFLTWKATVDTYYPSNFTCHPPKAIADSYVTNEDVTLVIAALGVLSNDIDDDGDELTAVVIGNVGGGVLELALNGSFTYTPSEGFFGGDSFSYKAFDGAHYSDPVTVTITITAVNDAPIAFSDAYETDEDTLLSVAKPGVLDNDTDADEDALTVVLEAGVSNGSLSLLADGSFTYMPDADFFGEDSFIYQAIDGSLYSDPVTVTIAVTAVQDAPFAFFDDYETDNDTLLSVAKPGVLDNDTDAEDDELTAVLVADVNHGTLSLLVDGSFTYLPNADFIGEDSFAYQAFDGSLYSDPRSVLITVTEAIQTYFKIYLPVILR